MGRGLTATKNNNMNITDETHCFAVPGEDTIIDMAGKDNLSFYYGLTLEAMREREKNPNIQLMLYDDFTKAKAARQDVPVTWDEITEERYMEWLDCLPPAFQGLGGFLVGEPYDHHATNGRPRFQACWEYHKKFYASSRPMTITEFKERPRDAIEKQLTAHNSDVISAVCGSTQRAAEVQEIVEREGLDE